MSGFSNAISNSADYREIVGDIRGGFFPFGILGAVNIHKALLIHSLLEETGRRSVVLVPDEGTASKLAADLNAFGTPTALCPAKDISFLSEQVRSREYEQARTGALANWILGDVKVLILPAESALQKTLPPQVLASRFIRLKSGDTVDLQELLGALVAAGYKRADEVEGKGQFAVRGGIVDFFPPDREHPLRMELWGDEVDTIAEFEVESQRRTDVIDEVLLTPSTELIAEDPEAFAEALMALARKVRTKNADEVRAKLQADADAVKTGRELCLDKYLNLLHEDAATPLSYLKEGDLLFVAESAGVKEKANAAHKLHNEELKDALETGDMTKSLGTFEISFQELVTDYENADTIYLDNFARGSFDIPIKELYSLSLGQTPSWNGTLSSLMQDCLPLEYKKQTIVVAAGTDKAAKALAEDLEDRGEKVVYYALVPDQFPKGFISVIGNSFSSGIVVKSSDFCMVCHTNLAASNRRKMKARKAANAFHSLDELHKGDAVVHSIHGIGIFEGIENLKAGGVSKDYLKLKYAKGDVLYVPVTQLDLISKYVGPKDDVKGVKLNRLGTKEWEKSRNKVRAAVADMAKELTELYAKRMATDGYAFSPDIDMHADFDRKFEYEETEDQLRCIQEIKSDMEKPYPMERLLCGDVGFGKTEVALRAAFKCIADGKQVAMLVPTTVLAMQHYNTVVQRFDGFPVNIEMLSRFRSPKEQQKILTEVRRGNIDIIVGTHRLISKDVEFRDLGLLIVDEEQRFGVAQKEKMKQKFPNVDVLTLSATPIPRTLNMAMSGIRDMSIIEEAPLDRHPIQTYVLEYDLGVVAQAIEKELRRGGQVYYMHNNVESILHCAAKLHELVPEARLGIAHGKMSEEELSDVWARLMEGDIDVLVCTTIIETGVDIPNVNTLIVENADRYGLSQLHQIRGRIGRSSRRASAYFMYYGGKELSDIAQRRLSAIREYTEFGSGFRIAMRDLELRGAGNLLGAQQHGHMESVGYDMYMKLLQEAINGEKEGLDAPKVEKECLVDLAIEAHIPEKYISSLPQRLSMYRRIADIRNMDDASDVMDELIDRFGDPPPSVEGLVEIALLRNTAAQLGIYEIGQRGNQLLLYWDDVDIRAAMRLDQTFPRRVKVNASSKPYLALTVEQPNMTLHDLKATLNILTAQDVEDKLAEGQS